MGKQAVNFMLEILRWAGVGVGVFLAFSYTEPRQQFSVLCIFVVLSLAGLTGIESLFFGEKASKQSGYGPGGAYQRQSGLNNLALAAATILIYIFGWGVQAKAAVMFVLLIFLIFSAVNHAYSALKEGNKSLKNFLRPFMTALLLGMVLPFLVRALAAS